MVGHVRTRARIIRLLGFPGYKPVFHIDLPRAGTGAVCAVGGADDLVVLPALTVGVFPRPILVRDDAKAVREAIDVLPEKGQSVEKLAHHALRRLQILSGEIQVMPYPLLRPAGDAWRARHHAAARRAACKTTTLRRCKSRRTGETPTAPPAVRRSRQWKCRS